MKKHDRQIALIVIYQAFGRYRRVVVGGGQETWDKFSRFVLATCSGERDGWQTVSGQHSELAASPKEQFFCLRRLSSGNLLVGSYWSHKLKKTVDLTIAFEFKDDAEVARRLFGNVLPAFSLSLEEVRATHPDRVGVWLVKRTEGMVILF